MLEMFAEQNFSKHLLNGISDFFKKKLFRSSEHEWLKEWHWYHLEYIGSELNETYMFQKHFASCLMYKEHNGMYAPFSLSGVSIEYYFMQFLCPVNYGTLQIFPTF